MSRGNSRRALAHIAFAALTLAAGCVTQPDVPEFGNVIKTCTAGQACDCTVTGNCVFDCPGGGCTMRCLGQQANCTFSCAGGGCSIDCAASSTGNCISTCSSGCSMTCSNTGNCTLSGCQAGTCSAVCNNGLGNCVCTDTCA